MSAAVRVAILDDAYVAGGRSERLGLALQAAGHEAVVLTPAAAEGLPARRLRRMPDAPFRLRKLGDSLAHLPSAFVALYRGRFDAAHAFTAPDALAAIAWARRTGGTSVFTCTFAPQRETVAARRVRLATFTHAVWQTDAVLAADEGVAREMERWMAVDATVLAPDDAHSHLAVYRGRRRSR